MTNSNLTRRLILSPWYQGLWGNRFALSGDQNSKSQFDNTAGGSRIATSVGGALLGVGGNIIVVDDPHNVADVESEAERQTALNWWAELSSTRLNDPKQAAIVVIMQRLHLEDVSGKILEDENDNDWVHLCIPMRHDPDRHCVTVPVGVDQIQWEDPRTEDGELMWPERFGAAQVDAIEAGLGPYLSSGRLQQSPTPKSANIFHRDWWELWDPPHGRFPPLQYILGSVDAAFTSREENDPSAITVWGVFLNKDGQRRIMLLDAWRKHLQFSADRRLIKPYPNESHAVWRQRTSHLWGLLDWVRESATYLHGTRLGVGGNVPMSCLLVEAKGPGISAAQELANRYPDLRGVIQTVVPKGDKRARALAVQPTLAQRLVYAPNKSWAEDLIVEAESFPKSKHDDLVDSMTQALQYLRDVGLAATDDEVHYESLRSVMHKPRLKPLYPI